jgi:hypothetical protein
LGTKRSTKSHRSHWNLRINDVCILRPQTEDIQSPRFLKSKAYIKNSRQMRARSYYGFAPDAPQGANDT